MVVLGHTLTPIWKPTNPSSITSHTLSVSHCQLLADTGSDQHRGTKTVWLVRLHLKEEHHEPCTVLQVPVLIKEIFLFCCLWCQPAGGDSVDINAPPHEAATGHFTCLQLVLSWRAVCMGAVTVWYYSLPLGGYNLCHTQIIDQLSPNLSNADNMDDTVLVNTLLDTIESCFLY